MDVVARRGNETIYAEVKGRTKSRPAAGLDTLYGQLLRRMPVEEVGDPNGVPLIVIHASSDTQTREGPTGGVARNTSNGHHGPRVGAAYSPMLRGAGHGLVDPPPRPPAPGRVTNGRGADRSCERVG